jgi:hypothetical protein
MTHYRPSRAQVELKACPAKTRTDVIPYNNHISKQFNSACDDIRNIRQISILELNVHAVFAISQWGEPPLCNVHHSFYLILLK